MSIAELEVVRDGRDRDAVFDGDAVIAGRPRRVWAMRDTIDTLLVVVPKHDAMQSESQFVEATFGIVAVAIRHQVEQASPDYLAQSRAASSERARTIVELTDTYMAALESLLGDPAHEESRRPPGPVGRDRDAIAEALGISESTVKFHVAAVLRKLGVASRGEAGAMAREAGIRAPDARATSWCCCHSA